MDNIFSWVLFMTVITALFAVDLCMHRKHIAQTVRHALLWSSFWILLALLFNVWIYYDRGSDLALKFLTGYLIEKSLSVDNLFVFLLIFQSFQIPVQFRHKVLFWGIIGAIVMRTIFILGGIALVNYFQWMFYVFGLFLIVTGVKLALQKDQEVHPENNPLIRWFQKWTPVTPSCESGNFFVTINAKRFATPLFLALIAIETSDLIFAIDSIPAILGITTDPFIVFTSNIFAILGLRSLYFALEGTIEIFHHLHYGLAATLVFIGTKMLIADFYHVPIGVSLSIIATLLVASLIASILDPKKPRAN